VEVGNHPPSFDSMKRYSRTLDFTKKYDLCTVGAGLSGTVFAERTAHLLGQSVLVMDARSHIAGNCYDYVDPATGVLMNLYGSHLFHTNLPRVWDYVTTANGGRAPAWQPWYHEKVGLVNGTYVPIPVNIKTVNALFHTHIATEAEMDEWLESVQIPCPDDHCRNGKDMALSRVGPGLYEAIFETYTIKQWNKSPEEMDASVTARIPVRHNFDPRYFSDKFQALPSQGYTAWFQAVLDHPLIDVVLETDFHNHRQHLESVCGKIVYTGPIDRYFFESAEATANRQQHKGRQTTLTQETNNDYSNNNNNSSNPALSAVIMEKLEYRSLQFHQERHYHHPGYVLPTPVVNYPGPETPYTRAVEYKQYLHRGGPHSIVVRETSSDVGEPYYPVPTQRNRQLYARYKQQADRLERTGKIQFVGRLAVSCVVVVRSVLLRCILYSSNKIQSPDDQFFFLSGFCVAFTLGQNYKYFNMDEAIDNALDLFYHGENNHWTTLLVGENFQAYRAEIDAKMQQHRETRQKQLERHCDMPSFFGEFGVEMRVMVPWAYAVSQNCTITTTGVSGTRYMYWFSDDHNVEPLAQRHNEGLPEGNPFRSGHVYMFDFPYDTAWLAPPMRSFFRREDVRRRVLAQRDNKPLLFISNKYRREWRRAPANYFSVKTLRSLLQYLTKRYTIVYKRFTEEKLKDFEDKEKDLGDKEMIRREFAEDVVLFEQLSQSLNGDPEESNLLMFSLMASSDGFLSVQGGMAVASSFFGGQNAILIKKGTELKTGGYNYFHRFSGADVTWHTDDKSFIAAVKERF